MTQQDYSKNELETVVKHGLLVFFGGFLGVGLRGSIIIGYDVFVNYVLPHNSDERILNMAFYIMRKNEGLTQAVIILLLNTIACFAIGLCSQKLKTEQMRSFVMTGILGGLSTLATIDAFFVSNGENAVLFAVINILLTFMLGIAACAYGVYKGNKSQKKVNTNV